MNIKYILKKMGHVLGVDFIRTSNFVKYPPARRMKLISSLGIDLIFDVGANIGQFAQQMRNQGYGGKIVSFEPIMDAFQELQGKASSDDGWEAVNVAIGNEDAKGHINVSENSYSSSILDITSTHLEAMDSSRYVGKEEILICKLDTVFPKYFNPGSRPYLKLDTQGFEKQVIEGAKNSLENVCCVQMEMSLVPLFKDGLLLADMINLLSREGFFLWSLEDEFHNPETGQLLQVNGIFVNHKYQPGSKI